MNWLLRRLLLSTTVAARLVSARWGAQDGKSLRAFLATPAGRNLLTAIEGQAAALAVTACRVSSSERDHAAGVACGMQAARSAILFLAQMRDPAEDDQPAGTVLDDQQADDAAVTEALRDRAAAARREPVYG